MSDKRKKRSLAREGELSEKTEKGLEVPIPKRGEFFDDASVAVLRNSAERLVSRENLG